MPQPCRDRSTSRSWQHSSPGILNLGHIHAYWARGTLGAGPSVQLGSRTASGLFFQRHARISTVPLGNRGMRPTLSAIVVSCIALGSLIQDLARLTPGGTCGPPTPRTGAAQLNRVPSAVGAVSSASMVPRAAGAAHACTRATSEHGTQPPPAVALWFVTGARALGPLGTHELSCGQHQRASQANHSSECRPAGAGKQHDTRAPDAPSPHGPPSWDRIDPAAEPIIRQHDRIALHTVRRRGRSKPFPEPSGLQHERTIGAHHRCGTAPH